MAAAGYRQFTLLATPIQITTNSLPYGNVSSSYTAGFTATGGTGALAWSVTFGTYLPPGLALSSTTGALTGFPTANRTVLLRSDRHRPKRPLGYRLLRHQYLRGRGLSARDHPRAARVRQSKLGTWHTGTELVELPANGGNGSIRGNWFRRPAPSAGFSRCARMCRLSIRECASRTDWGCDYRRHLQLTLSVTSAGQTVQQAYTIKVSTLTLQDATPPDAFQNVPFDYTFTPINFGTTR